VDETEYDRKLGLEAVFLQIGFETFYPPFMELDLNTRILAYYVIRT
jgi:hypothetical protein